MSDRTDVHRPVSLVTEEYAYVGCFDNRPPESGFGAESALMAETLRQWREEFLSWVELVRSSSSRWSGLSHCHHCGVRHYRGGPRLSFLDAPSDAAKILAHAHDGDWQVVLVPDPSSSWSEPDRYSCAATMGDLTYSLEWVVDGGVWVFASGVLWSPSGCIPASVDDVLSAVEPDVDEAEDGDGWL